MACGGAIQRPAWISALASILAQMCDQKAAMSVAPGKIPAMPTTAIGSKGTILRQHPYLE
jgi:hypothetical protein